MSGIEVFVDDSPGEVRGVVVRDGRYERLILQREDEPATHRPGARAVGRVTGVDPALRAAFVDLGGGGPVGFLPLSKGGSVREGEAVEVEVTAAPREAKGPALRRLGPGQGPVGLIAPGPDVVEQLQTLAPGVEPVRGVEAIRAGREAEEAALASGEVFSQWGLDLAVQRTRALIAVDIDHAPTPGRDARKGRAEANRRGLAQAARIIRLKGWGGLVVVDLVGTALDPAEVAVMAKAAFDGDGATFGPLSRFGLLQLALPWRDRPVEEVLNDAGGRASALTRAIAVVRALRHDLLCDTATPRLVARCAPEEAVLATPLAARLGPRAGVRSDPGVAAGRFVISED
ncbi:MAG: ribonuclease E/G [Brevundimonas sp.]|uniref:ribonuclease E/G n=1 Tax=Brevundimonas sp. TaxID=1871086 RepID=UPI00273504C2|nr:ribonuclease E/G [Brevundimonas sp.]MDP3404494.1 ribonuclease E/G [Brevundimonas sp.]